MKKSIISLSLALIIFLGNLSVHAFLDQNQKKKERINEFTPTSYAKYLLEKGKTDPEYLKAREKFLKFTPAKQQKIMYYINRPQILLDALETTATDNSKKELYGGDIVIKNQTEKTTISEDIDATKEEGFWDKLASVFETKSYAAPGVNTIRLTDTRHLEAVGYPVLHFTVWVVYTAKGNQVTSIVDGGGYYKNNLPVNVSKNSTSKYIHGNKAQTCIVWYIKPLVLPNLGLDFYNRVWHHDVIGNAQGGKSYRFYEG